MVELSLDADQSALNHEAWRGCPIHYAVLRDKKMVEFIVSRHPGEVRRRWNRKNRLPLHVAVGSHRHVDLIQYLLDVYPNAAGEKDCNGDTPLALTLFSGTPRRKASENIQILVVAFSGAIKSTDYHRGQTPLHKAIASKASVEIIEYLIESCPEALTTQCRLGQLPLVELLKHCTRQQITGEFRLLKTMIEGYPGSLVCRDITGGIPLHMALRCTLSITFLTILIDACPESLCILDNAGRNALHVACQYSHTADQLQLILYASARQTDGDYIPLSLSNFFPRLTTIRCRTISLTILHN
jgi:ankyrin repeat protein